MRTNTLLKILSVFSAISLAGCDVKDPIYNTPHPGHGKITLTTDWTNRTVGIDIPASYTVVTGDYATVVSGASNTLDRLFEPGTYRAHIYNTPEHITVSGTVVTVAGASGNVDGVGQFVQEMPGWLFTSTVDAAIEKDTDYELTAAMQQQVRQLTLVIEPTGGTISNIESISGYLSGAASTLDIDNGTHGNASNVALEFAQVTDGANAGKWSATVRLLGTAGAQQRLIATIKFTGGKPGGLTLDSDLTADLSTFNTDKKTPLTLGGKVVETPTGAGFTATIIDWTAGNGEGGENGSASQ